MNFITHIHKIYMFIKKEQYLPEYTEKYTFSDGICGRHLQIMVKTRGLGHALGRVVGRGLGRGDGDDSDGAPQHRRPTASAHRRRVTVIVDDVVPAVPADSSAVPETEAVVARDEPMVDADAQDTGPDTDAQDIGTQDAADEPEGFLGGPKDPSVLTEYADHVAANVWSGQVFIIFKSIKHSFLLSFWLLIDVI